jgi:hypothetical protein
MREGLRMIIRDVIRENTGEVLSSLRLLRGRGY